MHLCPLQSQQVAQKMQSLSAYQVKHILMTRPMILLMASLILRKRARIQCPMWKHKQEEAQESETVIMGSNTLVVKAATA